VVVQVMNAGEKRATFQRLDADTRLADRVAFHGSIPS
jgi:hypothetical protein